MPKQVIVIMDDHYPFGQCQQSTSQMTRVLVRKIYQTSIQERNKLLQKASIIRRLKSQQLIKIQSILQQEQSVHFLFQYVPIRLQTWISNINDQFIQNFRDQLIKFSSYLANNFIKLQFKLKNIGMDHNYGAKYFLDPINFVYDMSVNKQRLKSQYIREITNLFKPYIQSHELQEQKTVYSNQRSNVNQIIQMKPTQFPQETNKNKNTAFSPPTYYEQTPVTSNNTNKTKQKLEKYYQQMNASIDVQNEKILEQFMNVLDDQQQEQIPPQKKSQPQKELPLKYSMNQRQQERNREVNMQKNTTLMNNMLKNNAGANNNNYLNHSTSSQHQQFQNNIFKPPQLNNQSYTQNSNQKNQYKPNNNINNNQNTILAPPKIIKNSQIQPQTENILDKQGDQLQNRVRQAIQNSKNVIKRFRAMKQGTA